MTLKEDLKKDIEAILLIFLVFGGMLYLLPRLVIHVILTGKVGL